MNYTTIIVETKGRVGLITLNRPSALNALNSQLIGELNHSLQHFDESPAIGCIVIAGCERSFAAGADIKEMADLGYPDIYLKDYFSTADLIANKRTPLIAAVSGYALGGGCELALMCDFIYAADNAKFALPEISLGVIPGIGGTQRLARAIGKSKAMEMCMTGRQMDAIEAERSGLVAKVLPREDLITHTLEIATKIGEYSLPATMLIKECVNVAYESCLAEGRRFERRVFHSLFSGEDQKEGMKAFIEKRKPDFNHR